MKNNDGLTVYVGGVFDLFHEGHFNILRVGRKLAGNGRLIVAVNSDRFTKQYKGITPAQHELVRANVIRNLNIADVVFVVPEFADQPELLQHWEPDLLLHGAEWTGQALAANFGVTLEWFRLHGIDLVYVDYTHGISSTKLRAGLKEISVV